ncbi:MAG: hypothetical protein ACE5JX_12820 [Acidobacteriota bacterium]
MVLFAPKGAKEGVWEPHLRQWLPHIGGVGGNADFSNLAVFSHTDLGRKGDFPERFRRIAALADVVIIDKAHHFRNPGRRGDPAQGRESSRYYRRLRPLSTHQPWGVFFVKFEPKRLPVVALRRILNQVTLQTGASANPADRNAWAADDLLFVSSYGEAEKRQISFAHFSKARGSRDLPTLFWAICHSYGVLIRSWPFGYKHFTPTGVVEGGLLNGLRRLFPSH